LTDEAFDRIFVASAKIEDLIGAALEVTAARIDEALEEASSLIFVASAEAEAEALTSTEALTSAEALADGAAEVTAATIEEALEEAS
jgi:hypothetical protein